MYIPVGLTQNTNSLPTIQLEEKEYGLRLTLKTKFMEKKDFMHMDVVIKDSEYDTNHEHDVQLGEFTTVPSFISKNIDTDIVVKSNQVIALGGRLHTEKLKYEDKIPILGDIPLIGTLFRSKKTSMKENDLLFFLVPEIVDANEDINDTSYYADFKEESKKMHDAILDTNSSQATDTNSSGTESAETIRVENEQNDSAMEDNNGSTEIILDESHTVIEDKNSSAAI